MRPRCPSTVRSERKSAAATSLFVLPSATSAATRSSAGVSAPGDAARPLMRFSSARARSAQSAAPIPSKTASASSSVTRASRRRFSRRCVAPSASSVRPRSSGSSTCACRSSAVCERGQRGIELARLRGEESPAARAVGERRDALEPAGVPFVPVQELARFEESSELDERLDVVDDEPGRPGLDDPFLPDDRGLRRQVLDDFARPLEREGEESQSRGCDEDHETVRAGLDDVRRSLSGGFRPTALCLSETLERACAQREQAQIRLLSGLMSLASAREARLDVAEQQLELAEEEEEPGPRALVTQLVGDAQEIRESRARFVVRVDPGPILSEREERLVQNANAGCRCLEAERLLCRRRRRCPSEQRLRTESRQLHIAHKRQIAHLGGERQPDVGVPYGVVEPLEPPDAAGRDPFVGESQCLTIGTCQVDDLLEELPGLVGRFVEADASEDDERPRQFRAGLERCDHLAKLGLGSARVTGLEVEECRLDRPPNLIGSSIGRRQLPGAVEEKGRGSRGSTCARIARPHPRARRPPTRPARRPRRRVATRGPPDPRGAPPAGRGSPCGARSRRRRTHQRPAGGE